MNNVVSLCFLNKSSLFKNFCLWFCQSIPWHTPLVAPKMVNFAPKTKRNLHVWGSLLYPTEFFLSLLPGSVRADAYANVITKFSGIDGFPFSIGLGIRCARFARAGAPAKSKPSRVAVRWPSRDPRRPSQSEFLRIRVDLYITLTIALVCLLQPGISTQRCSRSS